MGNDNPIMEQIANPHELEKMYRKEPEAFKQSFSSAWEQHPDSPVLAVWFERLHYTERMEPSAAEKASWLQRDFWVMGLLAVLAGVCTRILFYFVERETIAPINLAFGVLPFIAAYFAYNNRPKRSILYTLGAAFLISAVYLNLLPLELTDSTVMAYLHLPIFLWVIVGLAFTGSDYRTDGARLAYLKFNGQFVILYAIMAISGMVLSLLTLRLFSYVGMNIEELWFSNVVLFGAVALSIVAAYLVTKNLRLAKNIAPYIAQIFAPIVLITLLAYLATVVGVGKNPFIDRNFLLSFNGILLIVLAVTIFSITERGREERKNASDFIGFALIVLALLIDSVALSAILFRLTSYGITPHRIAVLGVNLLIWGNLIWLMFAYIRFLRNKTGLSSIQKAVTAYLPVYGLWAAIVTLTFPLLFG